MKLPRLQIQGAPETGSDKRSYPPRFRSAHHTIGGPSERIVIDGVISYNPYTQMLNVWHIYLHLGSFGGKCRLIYHTLSVWDRVISPQLPIYFRPCIGPPNSLHLFHDRRFDGPPCEAA